MGTRPGPTTNGLSQDGAKLLLPKERLEIFNAMIGAAIDWARQTEQEPVMVGTAVNVDKNDGNLNIPEAEASELAATIAELETALETEGGGGGGGGGGGATLETGAAWLSTQSVRQKSVGNEARGPPRPRSGLKANSMLPMKLLWLSLNPLMMEESR